MGSYLVVANQTSGGDALAAPLRRVVASDPGAEFVRAVVALVRPAPEAGRHA